MGGTYSYLTGAYYIYPQELNNAIKDKKYVVSNKHRYYILQNNGYKTVVLNDINNQKLYFYRTIKCSNTLQEFEQIIPIVNKWGYVNVGEYNYIFDYITNNDNIFDISLQVMPILTTTTPFKTIKYSELFVGSNVFYEYENNNNKDNNDNNNKNIDKLNINNRKYKTKLNDSYGISILYNHVNDILTKNNINNNEVRNDNKYICMVGENEYEIVLNDDEKICSFFVKMNGILAQPIILTNNNIYTPTLKTNKWSLLDLEVSNTFRKNILKANLYELENINKFKMKERLNELINKLT
jgi:hypothetical protein